MTQDTHTTPLFEQAILAIINGNEVALQQLLKQHPDLATEHSPAEHQATLLHYVAANGVEEDYQQTPDNIVPIAKQLLDYGANPNQKSQIYGGGKGSTPLVGLVSSIHPANAGKVGELVQLFCNYGKADGVNGDGYPLRAAIGFRQREAVRALVAAGATLEHLVTAAAAGHLAQVQDLYESASDAYTDCFDQTYTTTEAIRAHALAVAAMMGHLDIVRYLVEAGVDINAQASSSGESALVEAVIGGHADVVRYLLTAGADAAQVTAYPTGDETLDNLLAPYQAE